MSRLNTAGRTIKQLPLMAVAPIRIEKDMPTVCSWMAKWLAAEPVGYRIANHHSPYMGSEKENLRKTALGDSTSVGSLKSLGDFLGLFGPPEYIAERILELHQERGLSDIFLMSAHHKNSQYITPQAELDAFSKIIFNRIS